MQIATTTLDGASGIMANLERDEEGQLWLNGELVLAVSAWGSRVGLTLTSRIVLISPGDYWLLVRGAPDPPAE